jgi:hypothetical protein
MHTSFPTDHEEKCVLRSSCQCGEVIKKPIYIVGCNKYLKDMDRTDPYLCYFITLSWREVNWFKKVVPYLLIFSVLSVFIIYKTLHQNQITKHKKCLHEVGRVWITKELTTTESSSDDGTSTTGTKQDPPDRLSGDFSLIQPKKKVSSKKM